MKSFSLLKMGLIGLGFGAVLAFTPSCRAQSEISPDHFDGTDSWETAARTPAPRVRHSPASKNQQVKTKGTTPSSTLQLAANRQLVAVPDKRKPAVRKTEKQ